MPLPRNLAFLLHWYINAWLTYNLVVLKLTLVEDTHACPEIHSVMDGLCDQENNIEECAYDGNDCCLSEDLMSCVNCNGHGCHCHETETSHCPDGGKKVTGLTSHYNLKSTSLGEPDLDKCPESIFHDLVSDGYCDDEANIEECAFDGGDCCLVDVITNFCQICECLEY